VYSFLNRTNQKDWRSALRIAISGSHSLGKSTVVNDWVAAHPDFHREICFREASTRLQNGIQLYYNISRIHRYPTTADKVIFDRAPVDYIAYSQYTANQGTTDIDDDFVESMVPAVRESLDHLDILAFVPKSDAWPVEMEEDGIRPVDDAYRDEVDTIFKEIYRNSRFNIIPKSGGPRIIELFGPPMQRLEQIRAAILEY
jgi:hypothetical protein